MKLYDGRESFYQWDLNQKLTSDTLQVGDEVHYSNLKQTKALITIAYELDGKVVSDVPNILLQNAHPINVDRYIKTGDSEYTVEQYSFKVKQKTKPSDYVYTETEIKNWEELDNKVKELSAEITEVNTALADLKKGTIEVINEQVNIWELHTGIYYIKKPFKLSKSKKVYSTNTHIFIIFDRNVGASGVEYFHFCDIEDDKGDFESAVHGFSSYDEWYEYAIIDRSVVTDDINEETSDDSIPTVKWSRDLIESVKTELQGDIEDISALVGGAE